MCTSREGDVGFFRVESKCKTEYDKAGMSPLDSFRSLQAGTLIPPALCVSSHALWPLGGCSAAISVSHSSCLGYYFGP